MQNEIEFGYEEKALITSGVLLSFLLNLDVNLPGNAQSFSSSYEFNAYKGFIEYSMIIHTKLELQGVKDRSLKMAREEDIIQKLRRIVFELSENLQSFHSQVLALLSLAEHLYVNKKKGAVEEQSTEYYANYTRQSKIYQEVLCIYDDIHDINASPLEKEAKACIKQVDNMLITKYKSKEDNIIATALKKTKDAAEEAKGGETTHKSSIFQWKMIIFNIGEALEKEISSARKKIKSKFCALVVKHMGAEHHEV